MKNVIRCLTVMAIVLVMVTISIADGEWKCYSSADCPGGFPLVACNAGEPIPTWEDWCDDCQSEAWYDSELDMVYCKAWSSNGTECTNYPEGQSPNDRDCDEER